MTGQVEVSLESECTEADLAAVVGVLAEAGIPARVRGDIIRHSAGELAWMVVIGIPASLTLAFLKSAFQSAGEEAGRDGWKALRRLVSEIYEKREAVSDRLPGGVTVETSDPWTEIRLPPGLPDAAYLRLAEIDTPLAPLSGILMWNNETQAWTDAMAEKYRCDYPACTVMATQNRTRQPKENSWKSRMFCDEHTAAYDSGDPRAWA